MPDDGAGDVDCPVPVTGVWPCVCWEFVVVPWKLGAADCGVVAGTMPPA